MVVCLVAWDLEAILNLCQEVLALMIFSMRAITIVTLLMSKQKIFWPWTFKWDLGL